MEDQQVEQVAMFIKVKTFLNKKASALTATPIVASTLQPELIAAIAAILAEDEDASGSISGSTEVKAQLRKQVETKAYTVGAAAAAYYTITAPNPTLREKCDVERSDLSKMHAENLYTVLSKLYHAADPVKALLAPFGVTGTDVDELGTALTNYLAEIEAPRDAIAMRAASGKELQRLIDETKLLLTDKLDVVMKTYFTSNNELYNYYQGARGIDSTGGGPIPDEDEEITLAVGDYGPGTYPAEISATSRFRLVSKPANQSVIRIGFSNTVNSFSGTFVELAPGQEIQKTAIELGYSPGIPYIYIHNPGSPTAQTVLLRVRVYF